MSKQPSAPPSGQDHLSREVGTLGIAAFTMNIIMGSGLFVLPGQLGHFGALAPVAILGCALVMGAVTLCFAEASSRIPEAGGAYSFVSAALGPVAGGVTGGLVWFSGTFAAGAILAAAADQVEALIGPGSLASGWRTLLIAGAVTVFALVAMRGAKESARAIEWTMAAKLAPLLLFVIAVWWLAPDAPPSPDPTLASAAPSTGALLILGIYLFAGVESSVAISGEVRNPVRTLPAGLFAALGLVACIAIAIQLAAGHALGPALAGSTAPLVEAAARTGPWLPPVIALAAVISMFGCAAGLIVIIPRLIYAFARDGLVPGALGQLAPKRHTPDRAIVLTAVLVLALSLTGRFATLAVAASLASMAVYVLGALAALVLRRRQVESAGHVIAWRATPIAAAIAVAANLAIIAAASWSELAGLAISIAVFAAIAFARSHRLARTGTAESVP